MEPEIKSGNQRLEVSTSESCEFSLVATPSEAADGRSVLPFSPAPAPPARGAGGRKAAVPGGQRGAAGGRWLRLGLGLRCWDGAGWAERRRSLPLTGTGPAGGSRAPGSALSCPLPEEFPRPASPRRLRNFAGKGTGAVSCLPGAPKAAPCGARCPWGTPPGGGRPGPCPRCRAAPSGCPGPAAALSGWEPGPLPARAGGLQGAPGGAGRPQGEAAAAAWGRDGGARSERVALKTARRRQAHLGTGLPPTAAFSSDLGTAQKPGAVPGVKAAERCA